MFKHKNIGEINIIKTIWIIKKNIDQSLINKINIWLDQVLRRLFKTMVLDVIYNNRKEKERSVCLW